MSYTRFMQITPAIPKTPLLSSFDKSELQELIDENPYLRGYIQGYLAERVLASEFRLLGAVSSVEKIPDVSKDKGDLLVMYRGKPLTVECKSAVTGSLRDDLVYDCSEFSVLCKNTDKREVVTPSGTKQSVSLPKGTFDLLAICLYPITYDWKFVFIPNHWLPEPDGMPGFIKSTFKVNTGSTLGLHSCAESALSATYLHKYQNQG